MHPDMWHVDDRLKVLDKLGVRPITRCDVLGAPPFSEDPTLLNRPYLTSSHRNALDLAKIWMEEAGMHVRLDPVANLIGRYEGQEPGAPALLIGSHIDTVRDGGRYDGTLGVMLGIEVVAALASQGRRFPFAIEVIAFGDEEGSRFPASMLCSRAIGRNMDASALDIRDDRGCTLGDALRDFGLDPETVGAATRSRNDVIAYIEPHIEQGPVLEAEGLAIGIVTSIAAQLRLLARFTGEAGHAGTTPMRFRRDAVAAAAAAILAVERICAAGPSHLVGTVGRIQTSTSAFNVISGEALIGIDLRAGTREIRDAAVARIRAQLEAIAELRGVSLELTIVQDLPECQCDPKLVDVMNQAVDAVGVRPFQLVSGAGHDAMMVAQLTPVGILFIRCAEGISHSSAESVSPDDVALAAHALVAFVERLAS